MRYAIRAHTHSIIYCASWSEVLRTLQDDAALDPLWEHAGTAWYDRNVMISNFERLGDPPRPNCRAGLYSLYLRHLPIFLVDPSLFVYPNPYLGSTLPRLLREEEDRLGETR